ncbi:unnamed protein product, partial [Nippostrongylus brasiliensis]|uniref:Integrase catalytic domain-containing protein n=1 Tax=Nippostrongylus brasiliensis TaxID=27835 RepID=A0A0N4XQ53_NIPBR
MVGLNEDSRDYTRFLWLKDPSQPFRNDNLVTYRFKRVPFGLVSSPFLLAGTIHFHLTSKATQISQEILRNTYVDNVFYGVSSLNDGITFYLKSKEIFQTAGMNLRAYASNLKDLNTYFESQEDCKVPRIQKLLGLQWDIQNDTISIQLPSKPLESTTWTKRKILKYVASIFDPLGFVTPATLIGKLILQSLWKIELTWDEVLPPEMDARWRFFTSSWTISKYQLPRALDILEDNTPTEYDIHVFTDASSSSYCAVAYTVARFQCAPPRVSFLISKSRLAPLKQTITIPRLELAALMIGAKLLTFISQQLDIRIARKFLWSDSSVALNWINTKKDLPVFVSNRVKIIKSNTTDVNIRHVPGSLNPADIGTRGSTIEDLLKTKQWWKGPTFLLQDEANWPQNNYASSHEFVPETAPFPNVIVTTSVQKPSNNSEQSPFIDVQRFSSWIRLLNTVVYVLHFIVKKIPKAHQYFGKSPF